MPDKEREEVRDVSGNTAFPPEQIDPVVKSHQFGPRPLGGFHDAI